MNDDLKTWIKEANSWEADKIGSLLRMNMLYKVGFLILSAVLLVVLLGTSRALYKIDTPHVIPVILHENDNGAVTYVTTGSSLSKYTAELAQIKSQLHEYVILREGYYRHGLKERFADVADRTDPDIVENYRKFIHDEQIKRFDETHHQDVVIRHIEILDRQSKTAEVFFRVKSDLDDRWYDKHAIIGWDFDSEIDAQSAVEHHNPMGFRVVRYEVLSKDKD